MEKEYLHNDEKDEIENLIDKEKLDNATMISNEVKELKKIQLILNDELNIQESKINNISDNIDESNNKVIEGTKELEKASILYTTLKNKHIKLGALIGCAISLPIIAVVPAAIGIKIGIISTISGSFIGVCML